MGESSFGMDASKLHDSPKDKHVHTMYNAAVASVINFFFIIFPTNPVRPCMSWNITKIFPCWDFRIMEQGSCH